MLKRMVLMGCLGGVFSAAVGLPRAAQAQEAPAPDASGGSPIEVRNALGDILFASLVGGVLGLSTLSFYDRPQDNIRNIFFGAGIGLIIATVYITANVATSPLPSMEGPAGARIIPVIEPDGAGALVSWRF